MSHSRFSGRRGIELAIAAGIATFALSSVAWADPMRVQVVEDERGTTIEVRSDDPEFTDPRRVVTSNEGAIFFFPGQDADVTRLETQGTHRLRYVQVGRSRSRAALRLQQDSRSSGKLANFVSHQRVPGGIDIRVDDRAVRRTPPSSPVTPVDDTVARRDTLAALEERLAGEAEAPVPVPLPLPQREFRDASMAPTSSDAGIEATPEPPSSVNALEPAKTSDPLAASVPETPASRSPWPYLTIAALGLLAGAGWWFRRRTTDEPMHGMQIVSRLSLAPRQQILWVRAGGRQFLLGATDQRIALLTELSDANAQNSSTAPSAAPADGDAKVAAFKARLQRALGEELKDTKDTNRYGDGARAGAGASAQKHEDELPEHLQRLAEHAFWPSREDAA